MAPNIDPQRITKEHLLSILHDAAAKQRILVAIAGPPGVGKSTFAQQVQDSINALDLGCCAILPMDGYHYDDLYLNAQGWRQHKGAPHTFDVAGLRVMLQRFRENSEEAIAIPQFDRNLELSRGAAQVIESSAKIILVEGNYLLLNQAPWSSLHPYFDLTLLLKAPEAILRQRLMERWQSFHLSEEEILMKVEQNDLLNVKTVLQNSVAPQYLIETFSA